VNIRLHAGGLCRAPAGLAQDAHGMRLVEEQIAAVFTLDRSNLLQRRDIAQHGVNALGNNQRLARPVAQTPHAFGEVVGIAMFEANHFRAALFDA
jgi:hypothetical protein